MFRGVINSTALTTAQATSCFENITSLSDFRGDVSFISTLRALVYPRMPENESIKLKYSRSDYDENTVSSHPAGEVLSAICRNFDPNNTFNMIAIHSFDSTKEANLANMRLVQTKFTDMYSGYTRLEKLREFYRKSFEVDCYINEERKNVVIFVDSLDLKKYHYLQVSILAFLPWYFKPEEGVSEIEMELIQSLREPTSDHYLECIAKIASKYDFREKHIRRQLAGFELQYERRQKQEVSERIINIDERIREYSEAISGFLRQRNESCITLAGLDQKLAEGGDSEIMEYFLCNKKISLDSVHGDTIYFSINDYLEYFDAEMAERYIANRNSFVYPYGNSGHRGITPDGMKKLMTAIFAEEPLLRIRFCAAYSFDLTEVRAMSGYDFPDEYSNSMPNPHIDRYACLGNYARIINDLLCSHNYIGAIEQCIASCKSLNWGDGTVMGTFFERMWNSAKKCIELPDGQVVSPTEAISWLEEQEKTNETEGVNNEQTN